MSVINESLSPTEWAILEHATGWLSKEPLYRNRYLSEPGCANHETLLDLVRRGIMNYDPTDPGQMVRFWVTDAGIAALKRRAPRPKRSKRET